MKTSMVYPEYPEYPEYLIWCPRNIPRYGSLRSPPLCKALHPKVI